MQHITGIKKYIYLLLKGLNRNILNLPLGFILFMFKKMRYEKFTLHSDKVFINTIYTPIPSTSYDIALKNFVKLSKGILRPFSVYIALTDRCHLNCWYCSNANKEIFGDLPLEDLLRIIKEIQDVGISCIGFTGGEPTLRSDLEELVANVDERSFTILFTSGYSINKKRANALKKAGLTAIVISLDSHIKEEHKRIRGSEIAFDDAISAVKNSLKAGIYTAISTVITKEMLYTQKIYEFIHYVGRLGVLEIRILEPLPCGKLLNSDYEKFEEKDRIQLRKLQYKINKDKTLPKIMALAHINSEDNYGCNAGRTHVYIGANGNIYPCDFSPLAFGNLLEEPFSKIYSRMNKFLFKPSSACIISTIYDWIRKSNNIKLPIRDLKLTEQLLEPIKNNSTPMLFKKLGFKG